MNFLKPQPEDFDMLAPPKEKVFEQALNQEWGRVTSGPIHHHGQDFQCSSVMVVALMHCIKMGRWTPFRLKDITDIYADWKADYFVIEGLVDKAILILEEHELLICRPAKAHWWRKDADNQWEFTPLGIDFFQRIVDRVIG